MCICGCPQIDCNELDPTPVEPIPKPAVVIHKVAKGYNPPPLPPVVGLSRLQMHAKIDTLIRNRVLRQNLPDAR